MDTFIFGLLIGAAGSWLVQKAIAKTKDPVANVKDYGAAGDGMSDDTAAVQAALDSNATGIVFPAGKYIINGLLTRAP